MSIETMKLALEALENPWKAKPEGVANAITALRQAIEQTQKQEPVAYDKTELNRFAQDLYDQKMREGKHGHYESMFHVIHQCIKRVTPPQRQPEQEPVRIMGFDCICGRRMEVSAEQGVIPAPQRQWVGLTDEEREMQIHYGSTLEDIALSIEAKLRSKNEY